MVQPKAGQFTCMYRTGGISFKFLDAISQRENKTEDSDSKNSTKIRLHITKYLQSRKFKYIRYLKNSLKVC